MKSINLIIIIFLVLHISCKTNKNPISSTDTNLEILPLKLNNAWYYQYTYFDSLGNPRTVKTDTVTICCDSIINGTKCFTISKMWGGWHYNDNEGLWQLWNNGISGFSEPSLYRKYPCKKGDKFNYVEVVSTDTVVNVIYGEVNCILYKTVVRTSRPYSEDFMKPGVGKIKSTLYFINSKNQYYKFMEYELVNYKF
jgi:hypothetical protein